MKFRALLKKTVWVTVALIVIAALTYVASLVFIRPSNDRVWLPEQAELATADVGTDTVTLHNVRDWTYDGSTVASTDWIEATVRPSDVVRVWFILEPFASSPVVGHTFLSFEFKDGTTLAFSVEARREADEKYSALKGLGPTYELSYQWGTERDFIPRRTNYLAHPVRMYPLVLPDGAAPALFASLIEETNNIAAHPRFYHTLFANCTNVLAHIINKHYPRTLPYDLSWTLTGLSDTYLMREGFIATNGADEETKTAHDLTPSREKIQTHATDTPKEFSTFVRTLIAN